MHARSVGRGNHSGSLDSKIVRVDLLNVQSDMYLPFWISSKLPFYLRLSDVVAKKLPKRTQLDEGSWWYPMTVNKNGVCFFVYPG